jgi:hypothetical protein
MRGIRFAVTAVLALASIGSASSAPPGWKTLLDKTAKCQLSVPANWMLVSQQPGAANSPASTTTSVVTGTRPYRPYDEDTLKYLNIAKLYENTATRTFYVTKPSADSKAVTYGVVVPGSPNACIAQIMLPASYPEDEAKQIAMTLAPTK